MPFPSTLSTFNIPTPTDRLNSPSHSALHNTVSSALGQVEAVIGVEGPNSVVGTLEYFIKSPASNGGGHIQTANKGGTGQTTYTKGDLLVASSSSVLTKQAIGQNGNALVADSTMPTGVKWGVPGGTKVASSSSIITLAVGSTTGLGPSSIMSASVAGSTLGISGVIRTTLYVTNMHTINSPSILLSAHYGSSRVASVLLVPGDNTSSPSIIGTVQFNLFANGTINSQVAEMSVDINRTVSSIGGAFQGFKTFSRGTSSINSDAANVVGFTATSGSGLQPEDSFITTQGYIVEKIV